MKKLFIIIIIAVSIKTAFPNIEMQYQQGMSAFSSGNYGSSELLFKKVIDSGNSDLADTASFYLCRSIFEQKKYKSALYEFSSFLSRCKTSDLCIESRYWIGESFFLTGEYVKAIEEYKRYIIQSKDGILVAPSYDRIGEIYYKQKRYDEAVIEWESSISKSPEAAAKKKNLERSLKIGEAHFKNNQYEKSIAKLIPIATYFEDNRLSSSAKLILGQIYQNQGNHQNALDYFNSIPDSLMKENPFSEAQYYKAVSFSAAGRYQTAKTNLEFFVLIGKNSPKYSSALLELGKIDLELGDEKNGIKFLEEAIKVSASTEIKSKASKLLGKFYLSTGSNLASGYLKDALMTTDRDEKKESSIMLARAYIIEEKFSDAEIILNNYTGEFQYDKKLDEINFLKSRVLLEKGETDLALKLINSIQNENPFSKYINESNYYVALANFKNRKYKEAVSIIKKYIASGKAENDYSAQILLFESSMKLNDMKEALSAVTAITNKHIKMVNADSTIYKYAMKLHETGKEKEAQFYFNLITAKFPDSETTQKILLKLADDYFTDKDYSKASDYFIRYLSIGSKKNKGEAFFNLMISLYNLKKYDQLISTVKSDKLPSLDEIQWKEILLLLSRSYFYTGRLEDVYTQMYNFSIKELEKSDILIFVKSAFFIGDTESAFNASKYLEKDNNFYPEFLYSASRYYFNIKKIEDASFYINKSISLYPDNPVYEASLLLLAEIYFSGMKYIETINLLNRVTSKEFSDKKNSMLVLCYFKSGQSEKVAQLSLEHKDSISKNELSEKIYRSNLEYYYNKKDLMFFNRFSNLLSKYKTSEDFILYYTGRYYLDTGNYENSYSYYLKLSLVKSEYLDETLFNLGELSLSIFQNKERAVQYYKRLSDMAFKKESGIKNDQNFYRLKAKIMLAIIYSEINKPAESVQELKDLISFKDSGVFKHQAQNLLEYYKTKIK